MNLIQALYDPRYYFPGDNRFYEQAMEDIEYFAISPQIHHLLKQQNRLEATPAFFRNRLERAYQETVYQNLFIKSETEKIFAAFEEAGIQVIPLKGVVFAEKYFGHIGARSTSDIDLLVRESDVYRAEACIQSLGFSMEGEFIPSHFHSSFAKPLPGSPFPLAVELHWSLLMEGTSNFQIDDFWQKASLLQPYKYVMELSAYHTFYMICLHGWKHALNSPKYFIDIIQLIHVKGSQWEYAQLFENAGKHRTFNRMLSTLSIVYRHFPHLEKIKAFPLPKRTRLWWDYDTVRQKKMRTFMLYVRFLRYQLFDYDSPRHSLAAAWHYLNSMRND